jgi:ADP-ribose pyrophosphatase YjhB (NUDIX family)
MTMWLVSTFPVWLVGIILLGGGTLVAVVGTLLSRRGAPPVTGEKDNQVATSLTGIVGSMYTLVLGFSVFFVWTAAEAAERNVESETRQLQRIYSSAVVFEKSVRDTVHRHIEAYVGLVIKEEWPSMASGKESLRARTALLDLSDLIVQIRPQTEVEFAAYALSMNALGDVTASRAARLLQARQSMPGVLLVILLVGWIVVVALTWLFRLESALLSAGLSAAMAGAIGLVLLLVVAFAHPFTGDWRVDPEPFEALLQTIQRSPSRG